MDHGMEDELGRVEAGGAVSRAEESKSRAGPESRMYGLPHVVRVSGAGRPLARTVP